MKCIISFILAFCLPAVVSAADFSTGDAAKGKAIYDQICVHCHHLTDETSAVGAPGFKGVTRRRTLEWINEWISGPEAFVKKDAAAKELVKGKPIVMPTFPEMQVEQNRMDIIAFLKTL